MTNVSHIHKLPTGISGFDHVSMGGLPRGRTTLVTGSAGSAKTVFGGQFLAEGIDQYDESGVFVTFQEPVDDLRIENAVHHQSSRTRVTSGNRSLDEMCGSGFFRESAILVSGPTGTGKTLLAAQFTAGGFEADERCLVFDTVREFRPDRVAVDSLSALERVASVRSFREFIIGLTSFLKEEGITSLFTATTPDLLGGSSVTEAHISTITDSIIILRYVESYGKLGRGITVLKMRGSAHDKRIRGFEISGTGMSIGEPFEHVTGLLAGAPEYGDPRQGPLAGGVGR